MNDSSKVDRDDYADSDSSPINHFVGNEGEAVENVWESAKNDSATMASRLGAQAAFQLDTKALDQFRKQIGKSVQLQPEVLANMRAIVDSIARVGVPTKTLTSMANAAAAAGRLTIPADALTSLANAAALTGQLTFSEHYWENLRVTARLLNESDSIPSLYTADQLALRSREQTTEPRADRSAETFFDELSVDITDVHALLKALAAIQTKHHVHRLVWRGQQDTAWPVHSSLYRKLEVSEPPTEELLIEAEITEIQHAGRWGENTTPALKFFADLQHYGAPTRLLDATVDPEIATWFAIEAHPELDEKDGRVIAWGRAARTTARKVSEANDELPVRDDAPFWHSWTTDEDRGRVGWGTGSRTWSWFPPALSDRMRAQRAGFLLEAGPLVTPTVAEVLSAGVSQDWRVAEITRATSIIGLPSRHDIKTKPNEANLVPLFSLRITASAKPAIRQYLMSKGLSFPTVYPDRGGLVNYLRGPFGLTS